MIVTDISEAVPFTPQWREGEDNAPVFKLRAGDVIERGQMEAELSGKHRAGKVWGYELRQATTNGILALLRDDPEERDRALELVQLELEYELEKLKAEQERRKPASDPLSVDDRRQLVVIRKILEEHWAEYGDLVAQIERRREIAPIVAMQRYCVGWENATNDEGKPAGFKRSMDGRVTSAALAGLSPLELLAAGNRAYALQFGHGEEKNSSPPLTSDGGPLNSSSDAPSTEEAGKSPAITGPKTRASRSRRGSGQS